MWPNRDFPENRSFFNFTSALSTSSKLLFNIAKKINIGDMMVELATYDFLDEYNKTTDRPFPLFKALSHPISTCWIATAINQSKNLRLYNENGEQSLKSVISVVLNSFFAMMLCDFDINLDYKQSKSEDCKNPQILNLYKENIFKAIILGNLAKAFLYNYRDIPIHRRPEDDFQRFQFPLNIINKIEYGLFNYVGVKVTSEFIEKYSGLDPLTSSSIGNTIVYSRDLTVPNLRDREFQKLLAGIILNTFVYCHHRNYFNFLENGGQIKNQSSDNLDKLKELDQPSSKLNNGNISSQKSTTL